MSSPNEENVSQPLGKGHVTAMLRLGLHEIQGAMYAESNVVQPVEYGVFGSATPGEIAAARRSPEMSDKDSPSILNDTINRAAERSSERSTREREVDMER